MRGADRDGQRIDFGLLHKIHGLLGVRQQHVLVELALETVAVLLLTFAGFQGTEAAEFAFDRHTNFVCRLRNGCCDVYVVLVTGRRFGISLERAIHHDARETLLHRGVAGRGVIAMVLVQYDRYMRVHLHCRSDHVPDHDVTRVGAGAATGLQYDRRVAAIGCFHDCQHLLHVIDIECRHAVIVFCSVIEQLS